MRLRTWLAGAVGAGIAYFLDPESGRGRRIAARRRLSRLGRHGRGMTDPDLAGSWELPRRGPGDLGPIEDGLIEDVLIVARDTD